MSSETPLAATHAFGDEPDPPDDVRAEIAFHLELLAEDHRARGLDPEAARRAAEADFGDPEEIIRQCQRFHGRKHAMLQKFHVAFSVVMLIALAVLTLQNRALVARSEAAMARSMDSMSMLSELRQRTPVDEIVIAVGDEVEIREAFSNFDPVRARVARDGKLLLPGIGWLHVAGLTRAEAEKRATDRCTEYYQEARVFLVVE